jgi:uracil phosphoribosyltransferase
MPLLLKSNVDRANLIQYSVVQLLCQAIHAANNINAELKFTELETSFENTQSKQLDEEQTLHDAANILRSSLQSLEMSNEYYPLPSEVSITESCKFIPHCLLNFIV